MDSAVKEQFRFNSIGDLLSYNTPVFIKNYGPGAIATTAFRGGNATQTAILWNGFNIQNNMLGQSDLTLMPSLLFENVEVEYGGSSSLWGSGAVGGSIHLNNKTEFGKGWRTNVNLGGGSFGLLNASAGLSLSGKKLTSSTKIYTSHSNNNFTFKDTLDRQQPVKQYQRAPYDFMGLMEELRWLVNSKQIVNVNAWYTNNRRKLYAADPTMDSRTWQDDKVLRLSAAWNYVTNRFKSTTRVGYFNDWINYTDSLLGVFSKSDASTFVAENENFWKWNSDNLLQVGINHTSSFGTTKNYDGQRSLSRTSLLIGNKFSFLEKKLLVNVSARAEYFTAGTLPLTGNVSAEYLLFKKLKAMLNAAKIYRQPALNELYWIPGGNPNLKPEQGYTTEGTLLFRDKIKNFGIEVSGAIFNREIDNWILWVAGPGGHPSPVNIQKVWSRGAETTWKLSYRKKDFYTHLRAVTGYVLSTVSETGNEYNNTVGKQLIYTPRYTVNGNFSIGYGKLLWSYYHQYAGYRFITSNNSQWLPPYHVSSMRVNFSVDHASGVFGFFASCNNLFNSNYSVIAGRFMPLRNYEIGINIQSKQKNKKQ